MSSQLARWLAARTREQVSAGLKADVGVVPRQFLREFINQMDLVEENDDYDPMQEYGFKPDPTLLRPEEQQGLTGASLVVDDGTGDALIPREDVW